MFSSDHLKFLECLSLIFIVSGAARSYPTLSNPMDWAHQAHQAPLFMGFSRQEHWSGLPFLSLGELPHPGIKTPSPVSPALAGRFYQLVPPGKPFIVSAASQLFLVCVCVCLNCGLYSIEWNLQESQESMLGMLVTRMWTFPSRRSHLMRWAPSSPHLIPASCYCYCSLSSLTLRNFLHSNKCSNTWTLVYCVCVIHLLIIFYILSGRPFNW